MVNEASQLNRVSRERSFKEEEEAIACKVINNKCYHNHAKMIINKCYHNHAKMIINNIPMQQFNEVMIIILHHISSFSQSISTYWRKWFISEFNLNIYWNKSKMLLRYDAQQSWKCTSVAVSGKQKYVVYKKFFWMLSSLSIINFSHLAS